MTRILLVHWNAGEAAERKERLQQFGRALTELRADWKRAADCLAPRGSLVGLVVLAAPVLNRGVCGLRCLSVS